MPFDIPDSWEWCKLKDVAFVNGGFAFKSTDFINKGTRVIRISDFNENGFINTKIVRHKYDDSLESFLLQKKNILLCMTGGTVGKSYFVTTLDEPMITNQRVATIKIFGALEEYVNLVILSPITQKLINNKKNSTNDNISIDTINNFIIPLPPLKEQERIVERFGFIETFIQLYRINETKLLTLNNSFPESFKKSILQEAVQGKLVPQDENDEPASVLLERIRAEKQKLIAEGKIKKDKNESVIFRRDNSHYEKLNGIEYCIDDEIPFRIPDSWEWIRLGSIGDWGSGATPSRSNPEYYNGDIPWLKTGDLNDGYIEYIPEKISLIALKKTSVRLNPTGSVLIAMYGATIGKVGILTFPSTTNQACCACFPIEIYNEYLFYFLMSQKTAFVKRGEGGAQPNISKEKIIATLMPLPPLAEQFRIAKTLNEVLNEIEKLKK